MALVVHVLVKNAVISRHEGLQIVLVLEEVAEIFPEKCEVKIQHR